MFWSKKLHELPDIYKKSNWWTKCLIFMWSIYIKVFLFFCPRVFLSDHLSKFQLDFFCTCLPVYQLIFLFVYLYNCLPVYSSTCPLSTLSPVHLSICQPVYLSNCQPVYLSYYSFLPTCLQVSCPHIIWVSIYTNH